MQTPAPSSAKSRLVTALAWVAILALTAFTAYHQAQRADAAGSASIEVELNARLEVGLKSWAKSVGTNFRVGVQPAGTSVAVQQRLAVLDGEKNGPMVARARLTPIDAAAREAGGDTSAVQEVLSKLYPEDAKGLSAAARVSWLGPDERELLVRRLGWFGKLALAPEDGDPAAREAVVAPARRTAIAAVGVAGAFCFLLPVGLVLWIVVLVKTLRKTMTFAHEVPPGQRSFGAPAFAAWLAAFTLIALVGAKFEFGGARWFAALAADVIALGALAVPVLFGVPWAELRRRVGLHCGRGFFREVGAGLVATAAALPIVCVGALVSLSLQRGRGSAPGEGMHPVMGFIANASALELVMIFVLVSVAAPFTEETMFRGVLYGHLREATAGRARWLSALVSSLVVGALFAIVHPQGWTAVPALASLGFTFCLIREWRGSLVAGMVAHGVWNGAILLFAGLALGG